MSAHPARRFKIKVFRPVTSGRFSGEHNGLAGVNRIFAEAGQGNDRHLRGGLFVVRAGSIIAFLVHRSLARSVWTAVALAPLLARTEIIRFFLVVARAKAPLKPAQSRRFATLSTAVRSQCSATREE
jgi:hypothetical protein